MPKIHLIGAATLVLLSGLATIFSPRVEHAAQAVIAAVDNHALPAILSDADRTLYHDIYIAQKKSDWKKADALIADLSDPLLLGHMLADRYTSKNYQSSASELSDWLAIYADHPQAANIRALAAAKFPSLKDLPSVKRNASLKGYGDDDGMGESSATAVRNWKAGLKAWQSDKKEAAALFSSLTQDKGASDWMKTAAAYWSYRTYNALGDTKEAQRFLELAAIDSRTFYGILARKHLDMALTLDGDPITLSGDDIKFLADMPAVRRILALSESELAEAAEMEMRALFPSASREEKFKLLALANRLNLASVQIVMANRLEHHGRALDFARYPTPFWQPKGGFTVDPALVYAMARQESGFHASAISPVGALGLMQLMPQTATLMKKRMPSDISSSVMSEPVLNITLGQNYIEHLLENNLVDNNLIYMLAAYNAGAGRLQDWKERFAQDDPLLFMESIPFGQTRQYVIQVLTNYWIYSELAGTDNASVHALASGQWPHYHLASSASQVSKKG